MTSDSTCALRSIADVDRILDAGKPRSLIANCPQAETLVRAVECSALLKVLALQLFSESQ
jgi:hypothetical protein